MMKIVKPNHEIILPENPLKHIERIGRICYKSEDAITKTSAGLFVDKLFKRGHHAMLEHFRFIIRLNEYDYRMLTVHVGENKYITFTEDNGRYIISASARGINDMFVSLNNSTDVDDIIAAKTLREVANSIIEYYGCATMFHRDIDIGYNPSKEYSNITIVDDFSKLSKYEYEKHAWYSILFTCDRGVTHEMVRHRDASFAQESTRFCNYSKGKYGSEIMVVDPFFFSEDEEKRIVSQYDIPVNKRDVWDMCMHYIEKAYMALTELGAVPQQARSVLGISTKADIVITAQVYEWRHIFDLRVLGKTGVPHPQIREVMEPAYLEMLANGYI